MENSLDNRFLVQLTVNELQALIATSVSDAIAQSTDMSNKETLGVEDTVKYLCSKGIQASRATVYFMLKHKKINCAVINNRKVIRTKDLDNWVKLQFAK